MKIILEGRSISWNTIYAANNYYVRKSFADQVHTQVQTELRKNGYRIQKKENYFKKKVDIDIRAYFMNRPIDSDNIPAKLYIDGLKSFVLSNDGYADVGTVTTESIIDRTGKDRVEIHIKERDNLEGGEQL